ncbi:MAG TPA: amidohydrolase family protein [Candidatus Limnocylindria bacterium]|nr:amidohydrolase family protein [Candidatus Limnocylindria bacterium]
MNLLIRGATVVRAIHPPAVESADVHVAGGRVAAIGRNLAVDAPVLDAAGGVVMPGNVNAHAHAYSALARGMPYHLAPPTSFVEILQRIWWRLDRALDAPMIRASALVAGREALLAGTTTLVDHHASPNAIDGSLDLLAEAVEELGLRSVLAYEVTDRDGPERSAAGLQENRRFLRRTAEHRHPLARGMVGAHASFTLSDETLSACASLAGETGTGLHVHVAEDAADEADAVARTGRRVVQRLAEARALDDRSLLAHAVHVDPSEAELVHASGATVAHNPRSNMNNGVGRTPLDWLGPRVALGTDGIGGDLFEESRVAFLRRRDEDLATGADWPLARLAVGSRLVGRIFGEPLLGRIEPGAPADLVVLDYAAPTLLDATTLAGHWIFGLGAAAVRDVIVAGEVVVRDRRLTRFDEREVVALAAVQSSRLWERLEEIGPHPFSPARLLATSIGGR